METPEIPSSTVKEADCEFEMWLDPIGDIPCPKTPATASFPVPQKMLGARLRPSAHFGLQIAQRYYQENTACDVITPTPLATFRLRHVHASIAPAGRRRRKYLRPPRRAKSFLGRQVFLRHHPMLRQQALLILLHNLQDDTLWL